MPSTQNSVQLAAELRDLAGEITRRVRAAEPLVPRLIAALDHLDREGPMTTSDLAQRQNIRHQSMSATVLKLELLDYVDREAHPTDVRKVLIGLTEHGRERLSQERARGFAWLADGIAEQLDDDEQAALSDAVALLARVIGSDSAGNRSSTG